MLSNHGFYVLSSYVIGFVILGALLFFSWKGLRKASQKRNFLENEVSYLKLELEHNHQETATLVDLDETDPFREAS